MAKVNLRALSRYSDSLSHVYLEHAVIEQEGHSIAAFTPEGRITLPAANLSSVILGPGTRITSIHSASAENARARAPCTPTKMLRPDNRRRD